MLFSESNVLINFFYDVRPLLLFFIVIEGSLLAIFH